MKIILKKLTLQNFKGIRSLSIDFNSETTTISGENGTGKTTIADAFNFMLFGKNSYDIKDFNIKTLDKDNNPIHKLEHSIEGVFDVDGSETTFKRVYKEKWTKAKGAEEAEMSGHETLFYYNNVPMNATEYKAKVDALVAEETMKLLTNPMYFNSMKWDARRKILMDITGEISKDEIIAKIITNDNAEQINELSAILNSGKSAEEYKRELAAKRKLLTSELSTIPTRIDEADRSMPTVENWSKIDEEIASIVSKINNTDTAIEDTNSVFTQQRADAQKLQQQKHELQMQLSGLQAQNKLAGTKDAMQLENDIAVVKHKIANLKRQIEENNGQVSRQNNTINQLNAENDKLREQWNTENARELSIDEDKLNCPICKQPLPENNTEQQKSILIANFNGSKQGNLHRIEQQGLNNKDTIVKAENIVKQLDSDVNSYQVDIEQNEVKLLELQAKQSGITSFVPVPTEEEIELQKKIDGIVIPEIATVDVSDLKATKTDLIIQLDTLKAKLLNKDQIDKINIRIADLKRQEKELAQQISMIERTEFAVQKFETAKINELDRRLTELFPMVQFKLFNVLINGGTEPCCELLINGVPFSDVNTAARINAGLSIINVLVKHYGISAPIFIDNKEGINNPIETESQTIFLTVGNEPVLTVK